MHAGGVTPCRSVNLMKRKQTPHPSYSQMLVCHLPPLGKAWSRESRTSLWTDNKTKRVCACTRERVQIAPRCARRSRAEREAQSTKVLCTERSIYSLWLMRSNRVGWERGAGEGDVFGRGVQKYSGAYVQNVSFYLFLDFTHALC